jgi:hypothetical protein
MSGGILEASLLGLDEVLDLMQCLVVHFVKEGFEAPQRQPLVGFAVSAQEFFFQPVLDGYRANVDDDGKGQQGDRWHDDGKGQQGDGRTDDAARRRASNE